MPNRPTADRFHAVPEQRPELAHLTIDGLREYRAALDSEESRVSYWRRVLQARLDLVRAAESGAPAGVEDLGDIFSDGQLGGARSGIVALVPMDDLPELPELGAVWSREPIPGLDAHNEELVADLTEAERQLSAYRTALHQLMAKATGELIARYREQPGLCLSALPSRGPAAQTVPG
jgi:hypothetical protein